MAANIYADPFTSYIEGYAQADALNTAGVDRAVRQDSLLTSQVNRQVALDAMQTEALRRQKIESDLLTDAQIRTLQQEELERVRKLVSGGLGAPGSVGMPQIPVGNDLLPIPALPAPTFYKPSGTPDQPLNPEILPPAGSTFYNPNQYVPVQDDPFARPYARPTGPLKLPPPAPFTPSETGLGINAIAAEIAGSVRANYGRAKPRGVNNTYIDDVFNPNYQGQ